MMQQYYKIKQEHPDKFVFFRLGDFYELFEEDAIEGAKILQITLTNRNQIAMCGIPHHQLNNYAYKLILQGKKIAIAEQINNKENEPSSIVERKVTSILTPGTVIDENTLLQKENNFLLSFLFEEEPNLFTKLKGYAIALDISTGEIQLLTLSEHSLENTLKNLISRYNPKEIIFKENETQINSLKEFTKEVGIVNFLSKDYYKDSKDFQSFNSKFLKENEVFFESNGSFALLLNATIKYIKSNYGIETLNHLKKPEFIKSNDHLNIDSNTLYNLELFKNSYDNSSKHSLISILDKTKTSMGGRLLRKTLNQPLKCKRSIEKRLNEVDFFYKHPHLLEDIRKRLKSSCDIERIVSRISFEKVLPKELVSLKHSLEIFISIFNIFIESSKNNENIWKELAKEMEDLLPILKREKGKIEATILEEPSNQINDGNFINALCNKQLAHYQEVKTKGQEWLGKIQSFEKEKTNINSLKIKYKENLGYFFEVTKNYKDLVPDYFILKQTLVNYSRFTTKELIKCETEIIEAKEKSNKLEQEIYNEFVKNLMNIIGKFQEISQIIGYLDVVTNFAFISLMNNYSKPEINNGQELNIIQGRHPVIEIELNEDFIANDLKIGTNNNIIEIVTGPNMSGKSTFLRQNALIVIMGHMGCFVPAEFALIPICDSIFTRIGAADRLSKGESTFLVEMKEVSEIIRNCTKDSLIIMDEIGRGTSTYDGIAIAWSIIEYINKEVNKRAKTLFATHYHELIYLEEQKGISNFNVSVEEKEKEIIFLKKVVKGYADKSYGIHVAKLAGLPLSLISTANNILNRLEKKDINQSYFKENIVKDYYQLQDIERSNKLEKEVEKERKEKKITEELKAKILAFNINENTPLKAINFIEEIQKNLLGKE